MKIKNTDEKFMDEAIGEAKKAYRENEVPIGAVIVRDGIIIGRGHNQTEKTTNPVAHAEVLAIRNAAKKIGGWRLTGCDLYVTVEPCLMCLGAAALARISHIIYGATEPKFGFTGRLQCLPRNLEIRTGILENQCRDLLRKFFKRLRK